MSAAAAADGRRRCSEIAARLTRQLALLLLVRAADASGPVYDSGKMLAQAVDLGALLPLDTLVLGARVLELQRTLALPRRRPMLLARPLAAHALGQIS